MNNLDQQAEQLLAVIRAYPHELVSWKRLERRLDANRDDILAAAQTLASWDYKLVVRARTGITFRTAPDLLTGVELTHGLRTKTIGQTVHAWQSVGSTNDKANELARAGAPHGTVVIAEEQTAGRGRLGRHWHSPRGTGVYQSLILRPPFEPDRAPGLSIVAALALASAVEELVPDRVHIKWPNDLLIRGRKVAGVLTELTADSKTIEHVIVGIGFNLNQQTNDFPDHLREIATSVRREMKRKVARVPFIQRFWTYFEREYSEYVARRLTRRRGRLRRLSSLLGRDIVVRSGSTAQRGTVIDFAPDGELILDNEGEHIVVRSGEVTIDKE